MLRTTLEMAPQFLQNRLPRNSLTAFAVVTCLLLVVLVYNGGLLTTLKMHGQGIRSSTMANLDLSAPWVTNASATQLLRKRRGYSILEAHAPQFLPNFKSPCWLSETAVNRNHLHCLPYFFLAGWPKCGTTDIYAKIQAHPQVLPGPKELHWWNIGLPAHDHNIFDYTERLKLYRQAMEKKCSLTEPCKYVIGDGSPSTSHRNDYWEECPANKGLDGPAVVVAHLLYHFLPEAKFILVARDPVERLYSNFYYKGGKTPDEFDRAARYSVELFNDCLKEHSVRWCAYWEKQDKTTPTSHIRYGLYSISLEDFLMVYPRKNFHILTYDDYVHNNTAELIKMFEFLELEPPDAAYFDRINNFRIANASRRKKKLPMMSQTRSFVQQFYKPYNDKLLARLNLPLDYWGY